ncbi:pancreas transcription factor 1 subunit alpha isoform X3 [Parasteatoda tepidariorum]|uniref:Putative class II basic helix-loop-helix protein n=1 Tax=Parasteatoda tepidariorum TaxID=114398 RepID=A0A2L2YCA4_PARTP|nr:pancreas transcription factor 1 subunit alpha [Parasteatoda tepidariorum]
MSSGKMPEYTMLTPLPLTPDVMPHDFEQLVNLGLTLPCELVPHYSFVNMMPPLGPTVVLENCANGGPPSDPPVTPRNLTSPEMDDHEDDDEDDEDKMGLSGCSNLSPGDVDSESGDGKGNKDPFAPHCKIPLPTPFSPYEYWLEPSFIRRRNERERQRVRNVNDGFERLKSHIPLNAKDKDKRLSKVEILRMAIRYINNLQDMLKNDGMDDSKENMGCVHSDTDSN